MVYPFNLLLYSFCSLSLERRHGCYKCYRVDESTQSLIEQKFACGIGPIEDDLVGRRGRGAAVADVGRGVTRESILEEILP